ncbi:S66 family peptidase [Reinekea blandensis]|uniref:LD-carboxypeptidase n=1 Tax=Reinekea blandensis MED297 TaxID=314283 RepID=A4BIA8_9GAMM|nr:S66 peptidase family protein [Reinekea blandensis]EAR08115.1 hypothetical protein MED297_00465 [Reinekea sp. MED297] [Reinekea blandensis MED297]
MTTLFPPALKPGSTIGFYSPSSPATHFAPKRTQRAIDYLEAKGYRIEPGALTGQADHYRAGSIQARADELNSLIRNPDIDCIMSTIGGANSNSLLPYIDYDAIRKQPKVFVGYSDVTAILLAIYQQTGLTTFYGPALTASFGELPPFVDDTYQAFETVTRAHRIPLTLPNPEQWTEQFLPWEEQTQAKQGRDNSQTFHGQGKVKGRLIGGNLNTMTAIWGSPYMPEIRDGDVLLIEDSLKDIATVERLFAFLKLNGVFDRVSAVLLGKHELFKDGDTGRTPMDVLREVLNGQPVPIVEDFDCSHTHPMLTLPIGAQVTVDFDQQAIRLLDCSVSDDS